MTAVDYRVLEGLTAVHALVDRVRPARERHLLRFVDPLSIATAPMEPLLFRERPLEQAKEVETLLGLRVHVDDRVPRGWGGVIGADGQLEVFEVPRPSAPWAEAS